MKRLVPDVGVVLSPPLVVGYNTMQFYFCTVVLRALKKKYFTCLSVFVICEKLSLSARGALNSDFGIILNVRPTGKLNTEYSAHR